MKEIMLGNYAMARGFIEGGVNVATGYPGTPSTEILEYIIDNAEDFNIYVEWSVNEKVAAEVGISASIMGYRSMTTMKSVGLNVASEPINAYTYMGVNGGYVMVSADDPSCHSTHTEQDSRIHAKLAYLPVLEPYSPAEGKEMAKRSFELSEKWNQPVLFRTTTRIAHSRIGVEFGERVEKEVEGRFIPDPKRYVNLPQNARRMRNELVERMDRIAEDVNKLEFNWIEGDGSAGIIASGPPYGNVKEAITRLGVECKILKLGTPHPIPERLLIEFLDGLDRVLVVEEVEPVVEEGVSRIIAREGIDCKVYGKGIVPRTGELGPDVVYNALATFFGKEKKDLSAYEALTNEISEMIPPRPPVLCPGCPHRTVFYAMNRVERKLLGKKGRIVKPSDIGCYTLGYQPPLNAVDTNLCMGASIGVSEGFSKLGKDPVVATIGDSTFFHAGIPPLLNLVFNNSNATVVVLDNRTTAMTGHQPHPGTGFNARKEETKRIQVEDIARACGVEHVRIVDAFDLKDVMSGLEEAVKHDGVSVIVSKGPCALLESRKMETGEVYRVTDDCTGCKACMKLGCPAMDFVEKAIIEETLCSGCSVCAQVCPVNAIEVVK